MTKTKLALLARLFLGENLRGGSAQCVCGGVYCPLDRGPKRKVPHSTQRLCLSKREKMSV